MAVHLYVYDNQQKVMWTFNQNNNMNIIQFESKLGIAG